MPILAMSSGTVTAVWGEAFLRLPNGQLQPVKVGDKVKGGQQIVTEDDGLVQITPDADATPVTPRAAAVETERVIADLGRPEPQEPPAAGLLAGGQGSLTDALRVDRIAETVTPLAFAFGTERILPPPIFALTDEGEPVASTAAALPPVDPPSPPPPPPPAEPPTVTVLGGLTSVEGAPSVFTVTLSGPSAETVRLQLTPRSAQDDPSTPVNEAAFSALPGADTGVQLQVQDPVTLAWSDLPGNVLTFNPQQTQLSVRVATANDKAVEPAEFLRLEASVTEGTTANAGASAQNRILDNDAEVRVFESGLAGRSDPAPARVTGSVAFVDADGQPIEPRLLPPSTTVLATSNGEALVWRETAPGTLTAFAGAAPDAPVAAQVSLQPDGRYAFDLKMALRHPAGGSNEIDLVFDLVPASVAAGAAAPAGAGTLTVHVVDDQPRLATTQVQLASSDTNVLIVLDTSNSMGADSQIGGLTRLQAALQAIGRLLDAHDQQGDVAVRIVAFDTDTQEIGSGWMTVDQAKAALQGIQLDQQGFTNYDAALQAAMDAFGTQGKLAGAQNVAYFLSDGNPSLSSLYPQTGITPKGVQNGTTQPALGDGIDADEEGRWVAFLDANHIKAQAVGLGPDVSATFLNPIAHDGQARSGLDGVVASDFAALPGLLDAFTPDVVTGTLVPTISSGAVIGADGFDRVASISVGTQSFAFDPAQPEIQVTTAAGGVLTVNMATSSYAYVAPASFSSSFQETVAFTIVDRDGDPVSSTLVIRVDRSVVQTGTDGADNLAVGSGSGRLFGGSGDDVLTGAAGGDELFGHAGNDVLSGGAGRDLLVGGQDNDTLTGGGATDVFAWRWADKGSIGNPAVDTVTDFGLRPLASGGDVLDLRDLLQGENTSSGLGNLLDFVRLETSATGSTLHVSSQGGFAGTGDSVADWAANTDQRIVLDKVDLSGLLPPGASQDQVLQQLLAQGRLLVDQA